MSDGKLLKIKVSPQSKSNEVIKTDVEGIYYKVKLTTTPEKGKANTALIKILAKHFKISKSSISIISGLTSRIKLVKIDSNN